MSNENQGHRGRLRERMLKEGLANFQDHEVLELLLYQFIPRKDTNKIAHNLLAAFGSFAGVMDATPQQLMSVNGVSKVTACNIAMLKEVWQRYNCSKKVTVKLDGMSSILQYARKLIADSYVEKLVVVYLDNATKYIFQEEFTSNNRQYVHVDPKTVLTTAMRVNAAGVILFHCHINGECKPSEDDVRFTQKLYFALAGINVVLLEHIIFNGQGEHCSFYSEGKIAEIEQNYKKSLN